MTTERDRRRRRRRAADNREPTTGAGRRTLEVANPASTGHDGDGQASPWPRPSNRLVDVGGTGTEGRPSTGTPAGPRSHHARRSAFTHRRSLQSAPSSGVVEPPQPEADRSSSSTSRALIPVTASPRRISARANRSVAVGFQARPAQERIRADAPSAAVPSSFVTSPWGARPTGVTRLLRFLPRHASG